MFNRANKITSLLLAAAAIASVMPTGVMASDEIKSEKGSIYNAIAYKDGKFYIAGQPSSKDEAAYYLADGKYSKLKDIDSEDKVEEYGAQYVEIEDGEYYLDLSNGKIIEDTVRTKEMDEASVNLRSKIKSDNDDRYDDSDVKEIKDLTKIPNHKFAQEWYSVQYIAGNSDDSINNGATEFNVYTDKDGNYIDADYNLGKIKVKLSNGKVASLENTNDADKDVRGSVAEAKVIGQDSDNIYRLAKVTVKSILSGATITEINGLELDDDTTAFEQSDDKTSASFDVIQSISKSQNSKKIGGIKYAKNTSIYVISDKNGKKLDLLNTEETQFTIVDGKIINYEIDYDTLEAESINLKYKNSFYYVEKGGSDHVTLQDGENSVDVDASGNVWALSDDSIYKFDNNEDFEKIYNIDKECNNLSVYDKDDIVIWNSDDDIYSLIGKKANNTEEDNNTNANNNNTDTSLTSPTTTAVSAGWVKDMNGKWSYNNPNGTKFKGWLPYAGVWYYLEEDGIMATGWKNVNNSWYFLNNSGAMKTGWINDGEAWFYCNEMGVKLINTSVNGYKLGPTGAWVK